MRATGITTYFTQKLPVRSATALGFALAALLLLGWRHTGQAGSADWKGTSSATWATTGNWTASPVPGSTTAGNTDVVGFNASFSGANNPTYPNSTYYVGAFWESGSITKDVTVNNNNTATLGAITGVDGASVGRPTGTTYGVVMDDSGTARKLTLRMRTIRIDNNQTFYVETGNNLVCSPNNVSTFLNGKTLTIDGGGAVTLAALNSQSSQTTGTIIKKGSGRVDFFTGGSGGIAGGVTLQAGTARFWVNNCLGAAGNSTPIVIEGGTLDAGGPVTLVSLKPITISGDFSWAGGATLDTGADNTITLSAGPRTITCNGTAALTLAGSLSGGNAFDIAKSGAGTLNLSAAVTLRATQTATVNDGTMNLNGTVGEASAGYGITKEGSGTLALNNTATFSGPVTVNSGRFAVTTRSTGAGSYSIEAAATNSVTVHSAAATLNMASLTAAAGSYLDLNLNTFGNPTTPVITVAGAVAPTTSVTINLSGVKAVLGQYPLIKYGSLGGDGLPGFTLGALPPGVSGELVNNTLNSSIDLNITNLVSQTWNGTVDGKWDATTANWQPSAYTTAYYVESSGFPVRFDDTASGNPAISLVGTLSPSAIVVNSTNNTYSFGGTGTLAGSGGLTKQGPSTLTVTTVNTLSGPVTISGGTLQLGDGSANNGSLAGNITDNASLVFANPLAQTYAGVIDGSGTVTKIGAGNLALNGANSFGGGIAINAGTLTVGNVSSLGTGTVTNDSGAGTATLALSANYSIPNNFRLASGNLSLQNADASASFTGSFSGPGWISLGRTGLSGARSLNLSGDWSGYTGTLSYQNGGASSSTYLALQDAASDFSQATIHTSGQSSSGTFLYWSGANNTTVRIGALSSGSGGGQIAMNANLSGITFEIGALNTDSTYGGVFGAGATYREFALTKVGTGKLTFSLPQSYTGLTTVRAGTLELSGSSNIKGNATVLNGALLQTDNSTALPASAVVTLDDSPSAGTVNLNFSGTQTIGALYFGATAQSQGTWGSLTSGAYHKNAAFTGSGILNVGNNHAPVAQSFGINAESGSGIRLEIIGGKYPPTDQDSGDTLTVHSVQSPTANGGTAVITEGGATILYTAPSGQTSDSFTYTVDDGKSVSAPATVTVAVTSPSGQYSPNYVQGSGHFEGTTWVMQFRGIPNISYGVEWAPSPSGPWTRFNPDTTADATGLIPVSDSSGDASRFYRTVYP